MMNVSPFAGKPDHHSLYYTEISDFSMLEQWVSFVTAVHRGSAFENAAPVRARICEGLGFLGLALNESRNAAHANVISADASWVTVRIIRTDEELMIARSVCRVAGLGVRIIGSLTVDEHHLTKDQLLEKAREFYANLSVS